MNRAVHCIRPFAWQPPALCWIPHGPLSLGLRPRRGASTLEFAVVAPAFFLVVVALVQFAGLLMSRNVLTAAAREGARVASLSSTVSSDVVVAAVEDRLGRGGLDVGSATIQVDPLTFANVNTGDVVGVTVSAPISELGWIWAITPPNASMSAEISFERE